jgi:hypothetical protein
MKTSTKVILAALVAVGAAGGYMIYRSRVYGLNIWRVQEFILHPDKHSDWMLKEGSRCGDAPFQMPVDGFVACGTIRGRLVNAIREWISLAAPSRG